MVQDNILGAGDSTHIIVALIHMYTHILRFCTYSCRVKNCIGVYSSAVSAVYRDGDSSGELAIHLWCIIDNFISMCMREESPEKP